MKQTITKSCSLFLFVMMSLLSHAQNSKTEKIISGNVIDNAGKPLPGVNVNVKGTGNGVVTDFYRNEKRRASSWKVFTN
jgi:uncharacterized GH25 family protein